MMPEGGDEGVVVLIEDAQTPGLGWANYHAADGCKCGTFEEMPQLQSLERWLSP